MRRITVSTAILLLALSFSTAARAGDAPVGTWKATIESPRGSNDIQMEFKEENGVLTGTWSGPRGDDELANVSYEENKLDFERNVSFQGNEINLRYSATIEGDTMKVTMTTPRGERQFTAKRVE